jgi:hypothetical protein
MRVPATTKLNRLHNVQLALRTFDDYHSRKRGKKVSRFESLAHFSELITSGTRDQTLMALWKIAFSFNIPSLVDTKVLEYEIKRLQNPSDSKFASLEGEKEKEKDGEEKPFVCYSTQKFSSVLSQFPLSVQNVHLPPLCFCIIKLLLC